jgi:putative ABC transport system substrate-binding protein
MQRRDFIAFLGGAAATWPLAARGQEFGRIYRVGALIVSPRDAPHHVAFFDELRRLGFIDGQNLAVDVGGYSLSVERFAGHAADLVKGQVDVILATGDEAVRNAQRATTTIPILAITDDMVGQGLVHSLAKPGGNTTGITILASELDGKRQEILIEAVIGVRRIAALVDSNTTAACARRRSARPGRGAFDPSGCVARGSRERYRCGKGNGCRGAERAGIDASLQQPGFYFQPG